MLIYKTHGTCYRLHWIQLIFILFHETIKKKINLKLIKYRKIKLHTKFYEIPTPNSEIKKITKKKPMGVSLGGLGT